MSAKVAAVILAAGASSRLGEPKQLVELGGETLLARAIRCACDAACAPVIVVLGAAAERILLAIEDLTHGPVEVRINPAWREGMGSSIRTGIAAIFEADVSGVLMLTCDQPFVTVEHLRGLSRRDPGSATASAYAGRRGVPAYLPRTMFGELTGLTGDAGARSLLREAEALELPFGELDVDTAESLAAVRAHWGACESSGRAS